MTGNLDVIRYLISRGADVNAEDSVTSVFLALCGAFAFEVLVVVLCSTVTVRCITHASVDMEMLY